MDVNPVTETIERLRGFADNEEDAGNVDAALNLRDRANEMESLQRVPIAVLNSNNGFHILPQFRS